MNRRGLLMATSAMLWTSAVALGIYQAVSGAGVGVIGGTIIAAAALITGWLLAEHLLEKAVQKAIDAVRLSNQVTLDGVAERMADEMMGRSAKPDPLRSL